MENHSRRIALAGPRPTHTIITRAAIAFFFFYEAVVQHVSYVTDFVELVELYTLHGERPPAMFRHGRRGCAATCQITRDDGAIIDIGMVVFGSIALFSLHARGSSLWQHSRQQARSSVLTITVRFVRCRLLNRCSS